MELRLKLQNLQQTQPAWIYNQFSEADWKMKTAVKTPTSAVTAKATVGSGLVSPKFCNIKVQEYCYSFAVLLLITS
jgi:hypothetical protein